MLLFTTSLMFWLESLRGKRSTSLLTLREFRTFAGNLEFGEVFALRNCSTRDRIFFVPKSKVFGIPLAGPS